MRPQLFSTPLQNGPTEVAQSLSQISKILQKATGLGSYKCQEYLVFHGKGTATKKAQLPDFHKMAPLIWMLDILRQTKIIRDRYSHKESNPAP